MIGQTISHYRIVSRIGRGGMGVVYRAEDTRLNRPVALKFLPQHSFEDRDKERFLREARTAARLSHPNICPIYEVDETGEHVFFAMAYLEGQTLTDMIGSQPVDINQVIDLGVQIANGLDAAHRHGVVHRDIKSSNVIVSGQGHAHILDFGLALSSESTRLTVAGGVVGTPAYMSPEQAQGFPVDQRTDIWSLGVVLFEMLTGRRPFERDRDLSVIYGIIHDPPPPLSSLRPDAPAPLAELVERMLAKDPERRLASARIVADSLRRIRDGRSSLPDDATLTVLGSATLGPPSQPASGNTARPNTPTPAPLRAPRRRLVWVSVAILLVVAIAAMAFWKRESWLGPKLPEERHIAILPFEVVGADETTRAISDGLVEMLTSRLSQSEEFQKKLLVVPSSEIRSRKITSAEEAHRVYGANLVVTGSAQVLRGTVQFNVNLIDAVNMRQLGARTFEFDSRNPIEVRNGALNRVMGLLDVQLSGSARRDEGETSTPEAYAEYLKGRGYLVRYDVAGNVDRALESLQKAVQLDPNYALAYVALAEGYWRRALAKSEKHWANRAVEAGSKAIALDPNLALAHARLGDIYAQSGRRDDAIRELRSALKLEPANADAHRALAGLYTTMGRFQEAEESYLQVTRNRPTDWYAFLMLGVFYWDQNRYAEAETALRRAAQLTPDNDIVYRNLAGLYVTEGKYALARQEIQRALKLKPSARAYSLLGVAYYFERRFQEAASALEASVDLDSSYYIGWGNLGNAYRWVPGSKAKAQAALSRAVELAQKRLDLTPDDYNIRANLAEYKAKLGEPMLAVNAEIARIPEANRGAYWGRLALAYELSGQRKKAVEVIEGALSRSALPHEVKDEPDLAGVLADPALRQKIH